MTMAEFETWVEQHYGELLAVAKTLVKRDPEDVLHTAVLGMWNSPDLDLRVRLHTTAEERSAGLVSIWPWAKNRVRGAASHAHTSTRRNGTKHLPRPLRGEEKTGRDTKVEERSKLLKLTGEKRGIKAADDLYLEKLEEDRMIFDMDGYGRSKKDKPFEVRFPGEES
jgi:hypothetical protein